MGFGLREADTRGSSLDGNRLHGLSFSISRYMNAAPGHVRAREAVKELNRLMRKQEKERQRLAE